MNFLHKIARPCGIAGGIWGILGSMLLLTLMGASSQGMTTITTLSNNQSITTISRTHWFYYDISLLIFTGLMGVMGIAGIILSKGRHHSGMILVCLSAIAMLIVSVLIIPPFLIPAAVLLVLAAIGLARSPKTESQEPAIRN
jgi:hypothetical protein